MSFAAEGVTVTVPGVAVELTPALGEKLKNVAELVAVKVTT